MTSGMTQEQNLEKQIEKQMGCMTGFLQLFDRHQILSGKRFYTAKRLTPPTVTDAASGSETSAAASPDVSRELAKPQTPKTTGTPPSRSAELGSPVAASAEVAPPKSPLPLPIFDLKQGTTKSSWKFKESPRLSLDSRATYDAAKGSLHRKEIRADRQILPEATRDESIPGDGDGDDKQRPRSSTSVIARLMGLEPLSQPDSEPVKPAELRRSASESRVTRDLFHYRFIEANNLPSKQPHQPHCSTPNNAVTNNVTPESTNKNSTFKSEVGKSKAMNKGGNVSSSSSSSPGTWKSPQYRRSWFEAAEVFPETPKQTASIYGEIEKRLKKMSGIDEAASKDLETLKQILEAWQLKGLLHSKRQQNSEQIKHPNFVFDRSFPFDESPIVVMRPSRSQIHRAPDDSPSFSRGGAHRNLNLTGETSSVPRERNARSPIRGRGLSDTNAGRSNSIVKQKALRVETNRRVNESTENRRAVSSSIHSPRGVNQRRIGSDPTVKNRSPRNKKPATAGIYHKEKITTVVTEDEASSISESTVSTSSQTDTERSKMEEYKEGRSLLERCDKLLHSIAEMTATDQQSSPVSVLDSSFYESASPSPIMKRSIDFKDNSGELEEETWSRAILMNDASDDCDLVYISEILRASHYLPEDSDIFSLLEKQQYLKGKDTSKLSRLQRKLVFDTIKEILERSRQLPPWKALSWKDSVFTKPSLQIIWSEFQKIRERDNANDLVEIICGILKKDLAGDTVNGWGECPVGLSEAVLDIERMIFRDLVGETMRDLATFACQNTVLVAPRRKLVF